MQAFRFKPESLARMIGVPEKSLLNPSSSNCRILIKLTLANHDIWNSGTVVPGAILLTGQTSWHMSHPKIQSLIWGRISRGIGPRFSIVWNEMHLVLSSTYGATIAPVGQDLIHSMQVPQLFLSGMSISRFRLETICPKKVHEPTPGDKILVFFPNHPNPRV